MIRLANVYKGVLIVIVLASYPFLAGCPGSTPATPPTPPPAPTPPGGTGSESNHVNVPLKDQMGNPITLESTKPYSPRQTCGACHDIDRIANGFHFQQGRTDRNGAIVTKADFFNDGRQWIRSPGMYGLW